MKRYKRIFTIIMDSLGIGNDPSEAIYGDQGANTLLHIVEVNKGLNVPNLEKLGLGLLGDYPGIQKIKSPLGYVTRLQEKSKGKDTMTGHWELMGLHVTKPFQTFTETGFSKELINELERITNRKVIGNCAASGTEIITRLGEEHVKTGNIIVYTSADSVMQIAAHEEVIPIDELYHICDIARELTMKDEWKVGRIIARPFLGNREKGFKRTPRRHDYALSPFAPTYLDLLKKEGYSTISIGKIFDIFNGSGLTESIKTISNKDGMDQTIEIAQKEFTGLCFVNLVDFDMEYGHRRDPLGYAQCIEQFDHQLGQLLPLLKDDDLLLLSADHGNDPTFKGSDHTRELVPLIAYSPSFKFGGRLEDEPTFGSLGKTIADNFLIENQNLLGNSLLKKFL